jgi:tetratricopeptide (TPR) repeat protein
MRPFGEVARVRSLACLAAALLVPALTDAAPAAGPGVGSYAPPLELTDLGGAAAHVVWGDGAPAATIVYFFDPQSSDCLLEMSLLDAVYLRVRDFGLAVYAVEAAGRQPAEVSRSMERYCTIYRAPAFAVLPDPAFRAGRTYGVDRAPTTFIMESHGVILNRIEGYGFDAAVAIARRVEQLLRRERGFLAPVLRESGVSEADEAAAEARIAAAAATRAGAPATRALAVGDRAPEIEYTDLAGHAGRWTWSGEATRGMKIVAFFGGLSLDSVNELNWLDALSRRGREAGLDVLAVEAGGMGTAELQAALEKYRRYNPDPSFPLVPDLGGRLARAFGPWEKLPQTYLLAGNGAVVYHAEGFSAGESEIMTGKVERAYLLAGRPFPQQRPDRGEVAPATVEEEAPSIRKRQNLDDRYRSAIVQGDAAFMAWEFDRALAQYLEALGAQPKDLHALVRAAQIYERRGEAALALEYWQRVLEVRPDHAEAAGRAKELRPPR